MHEDHLCWYASFAQPFMYNYVVMRIYINIIFSVPMQIYLRDPHVQKTLIVAFCMKEPQITATKMLLFFILLLLLLFFFIN